MNQIPHTKFLIAGAGPTGIGAAYRLRDVGEDNFLIFEASDHPGGLAASFRDKSGYTWDIGGHVQFSHYSYFDQAMEKALSKEGWYCHERESWIYKNKEWIPYPFQNNIHRLPKKERDICLDGLRKVLSDKTKPHNFKEWIVSTFGEGISKSFMLPYNYKVWAYPPEELNYSWVGERVSVIDINRIESNIRQNRDDVSWGPNSTFIFPKVGGTGSIWRNLARDIGLEKFNFECPIHEINLKEKIAKTKLGTISFDYLISTMPLTKLTKITTDLSSSIKDHSQELKYSSSNIIGVGIEGKLPAQLHKKCWMYFPEDHLPFYRVTVFSHYSPDHVPNKKQNYSLMVEVSESEHRKINPDNIINEVIDGLKICNFIEKSSKIKSTWYKRVEYGYPTPSLERDNILSTVLPALEEASIYSRGRFGAWKYEVSNQDHSFMQGVEVINKILFNETEKTLIL